MNDAIDQMIEGWAKDRVESVRESVHKPIEGFENWSLSEDTDAETDGTPLEAAVAVREAVASKGGRRPKVDYWKPVAAKVLGISRLYTKRWQEVLDAGFEAGLFEIDSDSLRHPFLVALDPVVEEEETVEPIASTWATSQPRIVEDDYEAPDWDGSNFVPRATLPCGHSNTERHGLTVDHPNQVAAREAGYCCSAMKAATEEVGNLNPGLAGRRKVHLHIDWRVRGLTHPVPVGLRRSPERERSGGFPGLCCDPETGLYIGGLGNNCRHYHTGTERCVVHAPKEF